MVQKKQITKAQAIAEFKEHIYQYIVERHGMSDRVAMRCAWNDYVDMLNKEGRVSDYHARTWTNPFFK